MLTIAYSATHFDARARPRTSPSSGMPSQKASQDLPLLFLPSQRNANIR